MKKALKYVVLSAGSILSFLLLVVFISILCDYPTLNYKATLILPSFFFVFIIAALISTIILAFKYSNNKPIKHMAIITSVLFILSGTFYLLGRIINPQISKEKISEYQKSNKINKDDFINSLFSSLEETWNNSDISSKSAFKVKKIDDIESEDKKSIISSYIFTYELKETSHLESYFFHLTANKNKIIEMINLMSDVENNLMFSAILNQIILEIDENVNIEEFDKKYDLIPFKENDTFNEEENFNVMKTSSDSHLSVTIGLK